MRGGRAVPLPPRFCLIQLQLALEFYRFSVTFQHTMQAESDREVVIFNAALLLPHPQRAAYLDLACAEDLPLRQKVERLLSAHGSAGDFLDSAACILRAEPAGTSKAELPTGASAAAQAGTATEERIGPYKLLQEIGRGGCGIVYMAEQEKPVRRRVALKLIKLGMDTQQVIARFEAERQALALMDHPNIAKVLDAGATGTGRPYFVMELVRGIKITEYCDQNRLPALERLKLFIQVCRAVQHAHQKGIIHRDLKPSNILVTLHDGVPVPKVIDFGIAKATTDQPLTDKTMFTRFEQFVGTPSYMSPEQAEMSGLDVDTRTDIYSLGVLLYELLTGRTPFDAAELARDGMEEMRRRIRQQEPQRPSTRLSTLGGELKATAEKRGLEPPRLLSLVKGDLDCIVMKALEKDRTRRYDTATGLAADIERHLRNEPITARPPSPAYRLQKAFRRHKIAFATGIAVTLALVIGTIVSASLAVKATRATAGMRAQRDAASLARREAEAINRFITEDLLGQASPDENAREKQVTFEEVLGKAARKLDHSPPGTFPPAVEASLRSAFGNTYFKLGALPQAERHLRLNLELSTAAFGTNDLRTLTATEDLAWFLSGGSRNFAEAEQVALRAWHGRRRILGEQHRDTLASLDTYSCVLINLRKFREAEPLARQCYEARGKLLGPDDPDTLMSMGNLGFALLELGQPGEARKVLAETLSRRRKAGLGEKLDSLAVFNNLGLAELLLDDLQAAAAVFEEAEALARRVLGPDHPGTLHIQHVRCRVLILQDKLVEAETLARQTLETRRRVTPQHEGLGRTLVILGRIFLKTDRAQDAEPLLREAQQLFRERYPMKPELAAEAAHWLSCSKFTANPVEVETSLVSTAEVLLGAALISSREKREFADNLLRLYQALHKEDKVIEWTHRRAAVVPIALSVD
jgi:serine/threonine protein kinase